MEGLHFQKPREFFRPYRDLFSAQFSFPRFECFDYNELSSYFIFWFRRSLFRRIFPKLIASTSSSTFLKNESFIVWIFMERLCNILICFGQVIFWLPVNAFFLIKLFWPHMAIFYFFWKNRFFRVLPCKIEFLSFYSYISRTFCTQYGK